MHRCSHRAGNEAETLSKKKKRRREIEDKLHKDDDDGGRAMMEMPLPETETQGGGGFNDVLLEMGGVIKKQACHKAKSNAKVERYHLVTRPEQ